MVLLRSWLLMMIQNISGLIRSEHQDLLMKHGRDYLPNFQVHENHWSSVNRKHFHRLSYRKKNKIKLTYILWSWTHKNYWSQEFQQLFPWAAARGTRGIIGCSAWKRNCKAKWNSRACLQAKQMAVRCGLSASRLPDTGFYWNLCEVNTFATKDSLFILTYHLHLTFIRLLNKLIINDQLIQMQRINHPKCNYVLFFHCKITKTWLPIFL